MNENDIFIEYPRHPRTLPENGTELEDHEISIVLSEEWEALYVDGLLRMEGESLELVKVLEELGGTVEYVDAGRYISATGSCPEELKDMIPDDIYEEAMEEDEEHDEWGEEV